LNELDGGSTSPTNKAFKDLFFWANTQGRILIIMKGAKGNKISAFFGDRNVAGNDVGDVGFFNDII
jgi:hypothetical protein